MATIEDLKSWINKGKFSSWNDHVHVTGENNDPVRKEHGIQFKIFTERNVYAISALESKNKSYLGCIADSRSPLPGENHTRGNDLADGDLSIETWLQIVTDIISYELLNVVKQPVKECKETCSLEA